MKNNGKKIAYSGVFAALVTAVTLISVPIPGTKGYINAGETVIFTSCFFFNPVISLIVCGLGASLADLILGYTAYIPFTFAVKALESLAASLFIRLTVYPQYKKQNISPLVNKVVLDVKTFLLLICAYVLGTLILTGGYFLTNYLFFGGIAPAMAELPFDLLQGFFGLIVSLILDYSVSKIKL